MTPLRPGWPLGMYIKYPASSEKKSVAKVVFRSKKKKVKGNN